SPRVDGRGALFISPGPRAGIRFGGGGAVPGEHLGGRCEEAIEPGEPLSGRHRFAWDVDLPAARGRRSARVTRLGFRGGGARGPGRAAPPAEREPPVARAVASARSRRSPRAWAASRSTSRLRDSRA